MGICLLLRKIIALFGFYYYLQNHYCLLILYVLLYYQSYNYPPQTLFPFAVDVIIGTPNKFAIVIYRTHRSCLYGCLLCRTLCRLQVLLSEQSLRTPMSLVHLLVLPPFFFRAKVRFFSRIY